MKTTSLAICAGVSLMTFVAFVPAGHGQTPCRSVDELAALTVGNIRAVEDATPEALAAFRELNRNPPSTRIVGGRLTLISDNPWQVALIRAFVPEPTRSQFCGGSIIRDDWILTAAHCVRNATVREDPERVEIVAGTSQYAIGGERLQVAEIHTHPDYSSITLNNDFALMRLKTPMNKGAVVDLIDEGANLPDGTNLCITGWGATSEGGPGAIDLLGAEVPTVSNDVCNRPESYNGDTLPTMLCAGREEGGIDACQGDSGGPAVTTLDGRIVLAGVVSWGEGCARKLKFGVYSRVSKATDWIAQTIGGQ